jgi:hypothetical protein
MLLKTFRSSRVPLLLIVVLALALSLHAVTPAYAWSYVCSTVNRTTSGSGSGFDCDGALARARTQAEDRADAACQYGVCAFSVTSSSCSGGGASATVNATYRCYNCVNGPCPF